MWIAAVLVYTGPKCEHFCEDCLCTLSALEKGITYTPNPLLKYKEFTSETHKFKMRTFEQLRADQEIYKESGSPKSKVKEYNDCEVESLSLYWTYYFENFMHASPYIIGDWFESFKRY